ncbi:putative gmc oxidoreductase protein [Neofusicoccum parvum]|nr:putative gmc oxidoreductase protein [Neofusicoccum parvum]
MKQSNLLSFAILIALSSISHSRPINDTLLDEYDYIIVGGGASGLTVANRLSEDSDVTVLVLEAGPVDQDEEWMRVPFFVGNDPQPPANALSGHLDYDWHLGTEPQTYLDGKTRHYPLGRGLGGGTLVNGLLWNRGNVDDYNDWATLGNDGWSWDDMLPYFQKSEAFSYDVSPESATSQYSIGCDDSVHGTSGPVNVSYQAYFYGATENFYSGLNELGVPLAGDTNAGLSAGASFLPMGIDATAKTRSDARRSHYDPNAGRENLYVFTGQFVTRLNLEDVTQPDDEPTVGDFSVGLGSQQGFKISDILDGLTKNLNIFNIFPGDGLGDFNGFWAKRSAEPQEPNQSPPRQRKQKRDNDLPNIRISGVEFATDASSPRRNVTARRDVILAAGAIHTTTLLQLSGIGDSSFLSQHGISTAIDLPGVGNNYQDHFMIATNNPFGNTSYVGPKGFGDTATDDANRNAFWDTHSGPWTAGPPNGVAFPSLKSMSPANTTTIANAARVASPGQYLTDGLDATVIAGWERQKAILVDALDNANRSQFEVLNDNAGHFTYSVMRPFSRGTVRIKSRNPFDVPLIDPRYGANPTDLSFLSEALRFNHRLMATDAMRALQPDEKYPTPAQVADDAQLLGVVKEAIFTEYHPTGTASMLPLELGGVVDGRLKVYGTQNLKIVDSSVMPMIPAAHLQACVYGVAEKAADLIKEDNKNAPETNVDSGAGGGDGGDDSSHNSVSNPWEDLVDTAHGMLGMIKDSADQWRDAATGH